MACFHGSGVQISHFCPYEKGTLSPFCEHLVNGTLTSLLKLWQWLQSEIKHIAAKYGCHVLFLPIIPISIQSTIFGASNTTLPHSASGSS
jgi:hypothetical protein